MSDPSRTPGRILVVDDTADLRTILRIAFQKDGWDVVEAEDGRQAIEAAREHQPDVVLLDLAMPVMDGLEALPSIRELCPDAVVVVLSGVGAAQTTRRALATGADGYLQKGVPVRSVLAYVRELVRDHRPDADPGDRPSGGGIVEVADEALFRVVAADAPAEAVLGRALLAGVPLFSCQPRLASHLQQHRAAGTFTADLGSGPVTVRVQPRGGSLFLHLSRAES